MLQENNQKTPQRSSKMIAFICSKLLSVLTPPPPPPHYEKLERKKTTLDSWFLANGSIFFSSRIITFAPPHWPFEAWDAEAEKITAEKEFFGMCQGRKIAVVWRVECLRFFFGLLCKSCICK